MSLRKILRQPQADIEQAFLAQLSAEETETYQGAQAFSWIPLHIMGNLFEKAAEQLYPHDTLGLQKLGTAIARDNLRGIYRLLIRLTTISYTVKQIGKLWRTYNDTGVVEVVDNSKDDHVVMIVRECPNFPANYREETRGYILGVAGMVGADNAVVTSQPQTNVEQWTISWGRSKPAP